ncbi:MAG TPA: guanylate kinase [Gemmatimonadales bacterium]|nr:guanylate kinase [Gemmatimonadales bacterium]
MTPFLLILSSPSGAGKTTITKALLAAREDLGFSVSATTRSPRPGEADGVDYYFLTPGEFERRRAAGAFLEWAEYGGQRYGTLAAEVDRVLGQGRHVILDIEVQGARQVRERRPDVVSIFVLPPSVEELVARLGGRGTDRPADLEQRLRRAVDELGEAHHYDYLVVNDDRTQAVAEVAAIIDAESRRTSRQASSLERIQELRRGLTELVVQLSRPAEPQGKG